MSVCVSLWANAGLSVCLWDYLWAGVGLSVSVYVPLPVAMMTYMLTYAAVY